MIRAMRRVTLYGLGLLLAFALGLTYTTSSRAKSRHVAHVCTPTDRAFIETAKTNMAAIALWGQQYLDGDAEPADVAAESGRAAKIVGGTAPADVTLAQARKLLVGVFAEYQKAMQQEARHRAPGKHILQAYGLANFAHDVLAQAEPALAKRGCDVAPLL
jgi:hypothetical protein